MNNLQSLQGQSTLGSAQLQQMTQAGAKNQQELVQMLKYLQMAKKMGIVGGTYMPNSNEEWTSLMATVSEKMMKSQPTGTGDVMPSGPMDLYQKNRIPGTGAMEI